MSFADLADYLKRSPRTVRGRQVQHRPGVPARAPTRSVVAAARYPSSRCLRRAPLRSGPSPTRPSSPPSSSISASPTDPLASLPLKPRHKGTSYSTRPPPSTLRTPSPTPDQRFASVPRIRSVPASWLRRLTPGVPHRPQRHPHGLTGHPPPPPDSAPAIPRPLSFAPRHLVPRHAVPYRAFQHLRVVAFPIPKPEHCGANGEAAGSGVRFSSIVGDCNHPHSSSWHRSSIETWCAGCWLQI